MNEEIEFCVDSAKEGMVKAITHFESELLKIRAGRANPVMLRGVMVDYYGSMTPISQVANVNASDARTLMVQPWEKAMIQPIETAIINANLGFNPQNNGEAVIINIPPLTEERRLQLVKQAKAEAENCKVSIRNARKEALDEIKKLAKDGLPEDAAKAAEEEIQNIVNNKSAKADDFLTVKEKDIMTI